MDQNMLQAVNTIIQQVLGSGLVLNGQVGIQGLTITSVDTARELGIVPQSGQGSKQRGESSSSSGSSRQQQENSSGQEQQSRQGGSDGSQVSRDEFDELREEIRYMRQLMDSSQESPSPRGRGSSGK